MTAISNGVEWDVCLDPLLMLEYLGRAGSDRQWRLFACACARRIWDMLSPTGKEAVEAAERFSDGDPLPRRLQEIGYRVEPLSRRGSEETQRGYREAAAAARYCTEGDPVYAGRGAFRSASNAEGWRAAAQLPRHLLARPTWERTRQAACAVQASFVRDIFTPFHPPLTIEPAWLSWDGGTVRNMAELIYAERAFDRLPVLADALEDAGCSERLLLGHCREDIHHVRGCWLIERLLVR